MKQDGAAPRSPRASSRRERTVAQMKSIRQGEIINLPWVTYMTGLHEIPLFPVWIIRASAKISRSKVIQVVVLTQTCDIVRSSDTRPYLQVARLIRVQDPKRAQQYAEGETPQYVAVPMAGTDAFVDLDQISTLRKDLIVDLPHQPGVGAEPEEIRRFAQGVARKFGRYPFPDYFIESVDPLRQRILRRWDKSASPEGRVLADLVQIRVQPVPVDGASNADFTLSFIMKQGALPILADPPQASAEITTWLTSSKGPADIAKKIIETKTKLDDQIYLYFRLAEAWAALCQTNDSVRSVMAEIVSEDEYVLSDYWKSERLDLDQLSGPVTSG
jgi:hypothetical protein